MKDRLFLDTNILIYAYSSDDLFKKNIITTLIENNEQLVLSTQNINEFINVMYRKKKIPYDVILNAIFELESIFEIKIISINTIKQAINISVKYGYSYFDSLIISACLENNCSILYSEDMHNGQIIESALKIVNPFKN